MKINKQVIKENLIYFITGFFIFLSISFIYFYFPKLPESIDNRLRDYMFTLRGEIKPQTDSVIIVDIDEKSLKSLGQWPWPRDILTKILENLSNNGIAIIGLDIVFAEEDRSSPHKIFKKFNIHKEEIPNFDLEFAKMIASTPTILGYQFEFLDKGFINKEAPTIQTIFIEKNKKLGDDYLLKAKGTILNIPLLQENAYSSGFFNNIPDDSGIIRSVPLIISYEDQIYPSLALETLRVALGITRIFINYDENGVNNVQMGDYTIPTDRYGRLLVNFRGKEKTFKYISALDIYNNSVKKEELENKIVFLGTSAAALMDLRATPFESIFPGVEVHANVVDNILAQDFLYSSSWMDAANLLIILVLTFFMVFVTKKSPIWFTPILLIGILVSVLYGIYYSLFNIGIVYNIFFPFITIIISGVVSILIGYFYELEKKEAIKNKFAAKVSKDVMEQLINNSDNNQLQSKNEVITVFFSDIRGFTSISESINDPIMLVKYLNQYMTPMSEIITKNKGTIDKYIGDAIMAYWNAPFNIEDHADKAVICAIEQIEKLNILNKHLIEINQPKIEIGIGITTGIATVGEIGSIGRSDYTVLGDTINTGSRIESLCKYYGVNIIISEYTKKLLKDEYIFRYLDYVQLKGKDKAVELWEVISNKNLSQEQKKELDLYNSAIEYFKNKDLEKSLEILEQLIQEYPNIKIYKIHCERIKNHIKNSSYSFVFRHTEK